MYTKLRFIIIIYIIIKYSFFIKCQYIIEHDVEYD